MGRLVRDMRLHHSWIVDRTHQMMLDRHYRCQYSLEAAKTFRFCQGETQISFRLLTLLDLSSAFQVYW